MEIKPAKTKEEIAKARSLVIKGYAEKVYPQMLVAVISMNSALIKGAETIEGQKSIRKTVALSAADFAITAGEAFADQWKKRRGAYLSVD